MLAAAAVALATPAAPAQVVPFHISGGGPALDVVNIFGADSPHAAGVGTSLDQ